MAGRVTAERHSPDEPVEFYHGMLRRFDDGLWGALFIEIGVMAMARSRDEVVRQAIELLEFERGRTGPEEVPVGPVTPEALAEFMAPEAGARLLRARGREVTVASVRISAFCYAPA